MNRNATTAALRQLIESEDKPKDSFKLLDVSLVQYTHDVCCAPLDLAIVVRQFCAFEVQLSHR
jgi:hypothetical protein